MIALLVQEVWLQRISQLEKYGGVPARYIGTTADFAEKCLKETPPYDEKQFKINRRQEIERILNTDCDKEKNS